MARLEWIEERLQNWARWYVMRGGLGGLGFATSRPGLTAGVDTGRNEATIPTLDMEATETDDAIKRLHPGGLRLTVIEVYTGRGGLKDKAVRLHCGVSTIKARIDQAHKQLAEHFLAQQDRRKAERYRVEGLVSTGGGGPPRSFTP